VRSHMKAALILSCLPLFLAATAQGGEGVDVKITNDGTEVILVTVYDMSANPGRMVLANARINGFSSVPISVVADASGRAHLRWTATGTDPTFPKCGHAHTTVGNADSVNVHADSTCSV
jgi:hypothetical protein